MLRNVLVSIVAGAVILQCGAANAFSLNDAAKTVSSSSVGSDMIKKLTDIGIKKANEQAVWTGFVKNCIVPALPKDKLASLAHADVSELPKFLSDFSPSKTMTTTVYKKVVSCPDALPTAQKIVGKLVKANSKHSFW